MAAAVAVTDTTTTATEAAITEATAAPTLAAANIGTNSDSDIQSSHLDTEWAVEWVIGEAAVVVEEADIIIGMVDTTKTTPTTTKTKIEAKEINETKTQSKVYVVSPGTSLLIPFLRVLVRPEFKGYSRPFSTLLTLRVLLTPC